MRQGVFSWEFSPCRLLPLLLVILLSIIGVHTVHGSSGSKHHFNFRKDNPALQTSDGVPNEAKFQLFNLCSNKYVQIRQGGRKGKLYARGKKRNNNTHLIFESHSGGQIYIRGLYRRKYICFNKKGKLILRHTQTERCLFKELPVPKNVRFTQIESVVNPQWYLGFGKHGKKLKGWMKTIEAKEKCFHYVVVPLKNSSTSNYSPLNRANLNKMIQQLKKAKS